MRATNCTLATAGKLTMAMRSKIKHHLSFYQVNVMSSGKYVTDRFPVSDQAGNRACLARVDWRNDLFQRKCVSLRNKNIPAKARILFRHFLPCFRHFNSVY
jgi:hypothetical protein